MYCSTLLTLELPHKENNKTKIKLYIDNFKITSCTTIFKNFYFYMGYWSKSNL